MVPSYVYLRNMVQSGLLSVPYINMGTRLTIHLESYEYCVT